MLYLNRADQQLAVGGRKPRTVCFYSQSAVLCFFRREFALSTNHKEHAWTADYSSWITPI